VPPVIIPLSLFQSRELIVISGSHDFENCFRQPEANPAI
jgi:hypothetical protein